MIIHFQNVGELAAGLSHLLPELGVTAAEHADYTIIANPVEDDILKIARTGNTATITYGGGKARFFRGLATVISWFKSGKEDCTLEQAPLFKVNGTMVDMSRNAVMNVQTVKFMMRKMALMGLNMFMLYTEDTYEVPGRPYFGHLRGRYTKEQIREMDAYAIELGIELIPCIQLLGHLATYLRWGDAGAYRDTANTLLVGAPETYAFIEDLLKTVSECFTTKRIHIGLDETHDLGTGKYLDKNGYAPREEIYFAHLKQIKVLLDKYGFKPMMWSDMFFRLAGRDLEDYSDYDTRVVLPEGIGEKTQGIQQVFWDYYRDNENFYSVNMEKHKQLGENTVFAGGIWGWSCFSILFSYSLRMSIPALEAAKKHNIQEVIATIWHNGSEANLILALAGLAWYADFDYRGCYDEEGYKACFFNATGVPYDDFAALEALEKAVPTAQQLSRALAYNDPLNGNADAYLRNIHAKEYYAPLTEQFQVLTENKGFFTEAFQTAEKLSALFELKADFGIRLREAYMAKDTAALTALAAECDEMILRTNAYRDAHRRAWMKYNSAFGWEVHDIRIGGMLCRLDTAKMRIEAYLNGEIDRIEELEAERLPFFTGAFTENIGGSFSWNGYTSFSTVNHL